MRVPQQVHGRAGVLDGGREVPQDGRVGLGGADADLEPVGVEVGLDVGGAGEAAVFDSVSNGAWENRGCTRVILGPGQKRQVNRGAQTINQIRGIDPSVHIDFTAMTSPIFQGAWTSGE